MKNAVTIILTGILCLSMVSCSAAGNRPKENASESSSAATAVENSSEETAVEGSSEKLTAENSMRK